MLRVHSAMVHALDAELLRAHELPLRAYEVLLVLAEAPGGRLRMAELAEGALLSRSGLTRLVDRLEKAGLLERERCSEDARGWYASITETGRELFANARETHLAGVRDRFLVHFTRDELRQLARLWDRLPLGS
jgi:DNA-binding MarR family transcriptional regulator